MERILDCFFKGVLVSLLMLIGALTVKAQDRLSFANDAYRTDNLDGLEQIPEWLMVQVEKALPTEGLNIWVPTGSFASSSLIRVPRFPKSSHNIKMVTEDQVLELEAVRNEQASAQLAIAAADTITNLQGNVGDLKSEKGALIPAANINVRFVKYVPVQRAYTGNTYEQVAGSKGLEGVSGFGAPDVVADPLIKLEKVGVPALRAQPIWFTVKVPEDSKPGTYEGAIEIQSDQYDAVSLPLRLVVHEYSIPDPKNYTFNLDIFMDPFSVADFYDVKLWSSKHWDLLDNYLDDLASMGQKKITTSIIEKPWKKPWLHGKLRSQTFSGYNSMIEWQLSKDNQWHFDYSIFDQYVTNALKHGNGPYISAYSMVTFRGPQRLTYFDERKDKKVVEYLDVKDERYKEVWSVFLKNFSAHLNQQGWLDQIYLGFDERPPEIINRIISIIKEAAPELLDKIYVSGTTDANMFQYAKDLNLGYDFLPGGKRSTSSMDKAIKERIEEGKPVNFYMTCCSSAHPNRYSYSPAVETYLLGWVSLKHHLNGYADWAYNSWPKDVFSSPVFNYPQGDEYFVYPGLDGPMSSIRWELLHESIEDYELVKKLKKSGMINEDNLSKAVELVTQSPDGRVKNLENIIEAKNILLQQMNPLTDE